MASSEHIAADPPEGYFGRKLVWQWQIRIWHWINVICVITLFFTGLYIAWPVLIPSGEPWNTFVMGNVRLVHFACAFLFMINFIWRIYWFWMGNRYARSGFPLVWKKSWWSDLGNQAVDYLKLNRGTRHLGHNALGGLAYTLFVILLGWCQIFSGMALYSESNPDGWAGKLFGWVIPMVGNSFDVRMWHHLFSWGFIVFTILHVYIIIHDGMQYRNGLVTSIISGYKFYKKGDIDKKRWMS